MIDSVAPSGESFEFEGRTYTIEPNVLCGNNIRALKKYIKQKRRDDFKSLLSITRGHPEAEKAVIAKMLERDEPDLGELMTAIQSDPDAAAILLQRSCPEVEGNDVEAARIASEYPSYIEFVITLMHSSGLKEVKNLTRRLGQALGVEAEESQAEAQAELVVVP